MDEMTVKELKAKMDQGQKPLLLDVRQEMERQICVLDDDLHIPMPQIPSRLAELNAERETVVYCRSGGRSAQVVQYLVENGFKSVKNLAGGILAWSNEIDPDMPTY